MTRYGYTDRSEQPPRTTEIPPQAGPLSQMPRKVDQAVKNPPVAAATLSQIEEIYQCDGQQLYGLNLGSISEGGAGATTINSASWWSDISRFCRWIEIHSTDVANKRINRTEYALQISPIALLDPAKPFAPFVWGFEDICAARLVAPAAGHKGAFHFGTTWENNIGGALVPPKPFIGIYANWTGTAYGTWTARCVSDAGVGLNQSLGISTEHPHRLKYGIDGRGQVTFAIDGVDLLTYDALGTDLGTHTIFQMSQRWTVAADDGATIRGGYMMDLQTLTTAEALSEAL